MHAMMRLLRKTGVLILAAIALTVLVAWLCSACVDVLAPTGTSRSAQAMNGEFVLKIDRWDRPGAAYIVSQSVKDWPWGPSQATGAPNTPNPGDSGTAWASLDAAKQREWLTLEYASAVAPSAVRIYENFHPGAVDRVTVFTADGKEVEAWRGVDPTPPDAKKVGISEIPIHVDFPIRKLTIHLNSIAVPGWNEIDAVGLVSTTGDVQWAQRASASSSYGAPPVSAADLAAARALLPMWGNCETLGEAMRDPAALSETRAIDGRGWPLVALWCERDESTGAAIAGALGSTHKHPAKRANQTQIISPYSSAWGPSITSPSSSSPVLALALPIRIAPAGFFADVAFFTLVLALLRWLIIRPWRLTVELSRMRHGRCIACGYDLGYDFRAGCPECGWRRGAGSGNPKSEFPKSE